MSSITTLSSVLQNAWLMSMLLNLLYKSRFRAYDLNTTGSICGCQADKHALFDPRHIELHSFLLKKGCASPRVITVAVATARSQHSTSPQVSNGSGADAFCCAYSPDASNSSSADRFVIPPPNAVLGETNCRLRMFALMPLLSLL